MAAINVNAAKKYMYISSDTTNDNVKILNFCKKNITLVIIPITPASKANGSKALLELLDIIPVISLILSNYYLKLVVLYIIFIKSPSFLLLQQL